MLLLRHVSRNSFVLIRATSEVRAARELLGRLFARAKVTHVIVERADRRGYHLLAKREADEMLAGSPDESTVFEAFGLDGAETTAEFDAHAPAAQAPAECVVFDEGRLVGYYDARQHLRGPTRGGRPKAHALEADFPGEVAVGEVATLSLSLTGHPAAAASSSRINLPQGARVDLVVRAERGFKLEEDGRASLFVPGRGGDSPAAVFKLKAVRAGRGRIRVLAFHGGQQVSDLPLGSVVIAAPGGGELQHGAPPEPRALRYREALEEVSVRQPDLSILILEDVNARGHLLDFFVTARDPRHGLNLAHFGPVQLRAEPFQLFRDFLREIEDVPTDMVGQRVLESRASYLCEEVVPEKLREFLWEYRDEIRTVHVQSQEPWIPWELCRLSGKGGAGGNFLCEQFVVTRWLPGVPVRPHLKLDVMALVVPKGSGLKHAQAECAAIEEAARGKWRAEKLPATYLEVCDGFASGRFSSWHFTGHGNAPDTTNDPDRFPITLDGEQPLTPADISGVTANLGASTPLVFFNACRIARGGFSLTGPGGWARRLLRAGAGAFVSALWAVYDKPACEFAKTFYESLEGGQSVGEAVHTARTKIAAEGDPTRLAYVVYAHPFASVRLK